MSEPFRTRDFHPVPASERPRRTRQGVRVLITDGVAVLLMRDTDPGVPGSSWWTTPGGGIDPGETLRETAVRELAEETGLVVDEADLLGPVLIRDALHGFSDQIQLQHEWFFVLRTPRFAIDTSGYTADEQLTVAEAAWIPLTEVARVTVWADVPLLLSLADQPERWPVDVGLVEESIVEVTDG
ncbi:MAG: NUDIX domain-containing protein [Propionibacteriaceae bacterium]|nr:NUDIX domain-containing protein [Micropruina sp.]